MATLGVSDCERCGTCGQQPCHRSGVDPGYGPFHERVTLAPAGCVAGLGLAADLSLLARNATSQNGRPFCLTTAALLPNLLLPNVDVEVVPGVDEVVHVL